jgi:predicted dehydrogenase
MRLALIGAGMHWQTYAPALNAFPDIQLVAVAPASPDEATGAFDHAPGLTVETRRYDDARQLLDREKPDVVQVGCRPDYVTHWTRACLDRHIPVMAEKPLAMNLANLETLYRAAQRTRTPLVPMHTMRGEPTLAAISAAVHGGAIGEPSLGFSQKSYKWGATRPDWYKTRRTFPGLMPFIGVHALDWLHWMLGDVFTEVSGSESSALRPEYPACATVAAYTFRMKNGGSVAVTLDYLRPEKARTHGDERVRLAGPKGVIETVLIDNRVTLIDADGARGLPLTPQPDIFTAFVRALRERTPLPISIGDSFRITEIVLKAQQASDSGKAVSLANSPYTHNAESKPA